MTELPRAIALVLGMLLATSVNARNISLDSTTLGSIEAPQSTERYAVNFVDVEMQEFIRSIAQTLQLDVTIDPRVRGTVNVTSHAPVSRDELYQLMIDELRLSGFTALRQADGRLRVIPEQIARTQPVPVGIESTEGNEIATEIIETRHLDAQALATILEPLIDPQVGALTPYPGGRALVVTDYRDNLVRLRRVARDLDQQQAAETDVVTLQHADAESLAGTLQSVVESEGDPRLQVTAAPRGNALVIRGDRQQRQRLSQLIAGLDTPQQGSNGTEVIYLNHADAASVAEVLGGIGDTGHASATSTPGPEAVSSRAEGGSTSTHAVSTQRGQNGSTVSVHSATNAIVLSGSADTLAAYRHIIQRLDIPRAQVAVEAIIAEISESRSEELGVQWLFQGSNGALASSSFGNPGINAAVAAHASGDDTLLGSLISQLSGITTGVAKLDGSGANFAVLLNALQNDSETNLLSTPSLTTLDNTEASILVGQEVPFITGSTTADNTNPFQTIQRKDVGIKLNILPTISADDSIRLRIIQEVSSIDESIEASDVVTNKREIETTVLTQDGGIIVLGGLISDQGSNGEQKVPVLGDIPLIGNLFRYSRDSNEKRNLMVFIRARVLRDSGPLHSVTADRYAQMRSLQQDAQLPPEQMLPPLPRQSSPFSTDLPTPQPAHNAESAMIQALYPSGRERLGSLAQ